MIFYILSLPHKLLFLNWDKVVINHYTVIANCKSSDYSVNFYFALVMMTIPIFLHDLMVNIYLPSYSSKTNCYTNKSLLKTKYSQLTCLHFTTNYHI